MNIIYFNVKIDSDNVSECLNDVYRKHPEYFGCKECAEKMTDIGKLHCLGFSDINFNDKENTTEIGQYQQYADKELQQLLEILKLFGEHCGLGLITIIISDKGKIKKVNEALKIVNIEPWIINIINPEDMDEIYVDYISSTYDEVLERIESNPKKFLNNCKSICEFEDNGGEVRVLELSDLDQI